MDVGIVGASGYGGAELLRLLAGHPSLKVRTVAAGSLAGRDLAEVFPHLGMTGTLAPSEPDALDGCDLVFCSTPHEASMELAPALLDQGAAVVDISGAFRLDAETFEQWYGLKHTVPSLTPAVYGLPELWPADIEGARLVANPGCYPTAALLALCPLGALAEPASVVITGMSGTSGAGKGLRDDLHASHAMGNVAPYGAPRHRHTPEIEAGWARATGTDAAVSFTPHLVPMPRGEVVTVSASLRDGVEGPDVREAYAAAYDAEPFVTLLADGTWPASAHTLGANAAHLGFAVDRRTRRVTVSCALDNLVKGAAGQAIQNANIVLGLPHATGLTGAGVYP